MQIGIFGLGKMGGNMVKRLLQHGHEVVAGNRSEEPIKKAEEDGAVGAYSLEALVEKLNEPRTAWIMVPAGKATEETIERLEGLLSSGDTVINGANSYYKKDPAHAESLSAKGIHYLDAGVSGGIWGLEIGYCLMLGGEREAYEKHEPVFRSLAPENGYAYLGPHGSGHYVKMIHNGIEYGLMQAYAEGFELLAKSEFGLDLGRVARLWMQGSVVRSWLLELAASALEKDAPLKEIEGHVEDSGEGRWTVFDAIEKDVPATVITQALYTRFRSRQKPPEDSFAEKLLAALRREFGGHAVKKKN